MESKGGIMVDKGNGGWKWEGKGESKTRNETRKREKQKQHGRQGATRESLKPTQQKARLIRSGKKERAKTHTRK